MLTISEADQNWLRCWRLCRCAVRCQLDSPNFGRRAPGHKRPVCVVVESSPLQPKNMTAQSNHPTGRLMVDQDHAYAAFQSPPRWLMMNGAYEWIRSEWPSASVAS